jgi:hypothetical protein
MTRFDPIFLQRRQINDNTWNAHISRSVQRVVYAKTDYLDAACDDWNALVWPSAEAFTLVMPLPVRSKFGKQVLYQPLFCQYLGLFSKDVISPELIAAFLNALSRRFSYISAYAFSPENTFQLQCCQEYFPEFDFKMLHTHQLSLFPAYKDIFKANSADRKRNLRKGRSEKWDIIFSADINPLIHLFKQNHEPAIGPVNPLAYQRLSSIFNVLSTEGNVQIHYALKNGQVCAGIMLISCERKVIYIFNAANEAGRKGNARTVLLDSFFQEQAGSHLLFDFESPEIASISDFYQSFGSSKTPYYQITKNRLGFPFRQIQNWRKKVAAQNQLMSLRRPL